MQINDIKQNLSLSQVLQHYNLQPNKNKMLCCPFHQDKTASLQVNLDKNFYKCHACGAKGDQIQFVQDYEKLSKHEALKKCATLAGNQTPVINKQTPTKPMEQEKQIEFLEKLYETFVKSAYLSGHAKDYLQSRNLLSLLEKRGLIGFNSGQFHHAGRFENEANPEQAKKEMIQNALEIGMLTPLNRVNNQTGEAVTYQVFGMKSIVFPLRNNKGQIVSYYFRSIEDKNYKHFYLKNRQGLYPHYPKPETKKLILTEAVIDCASLLHIPEITNNYSVLACYGTNGLTPEHTQAVSQLKELEEIIFFFDADKAGRTATAKYAKELCALIPPLGVRGLTQVETPEGEDVNSLLIAYEKEIFIELLENRKPVLLSSEKTLIEKIQEQEDIAPTTEEQAPIREKIAPKKNTPNQKLVVKASEVLSVVEFLKDKKLIHNLNELIGQAGIVGEENARLLLFLILLSYLNNNPLHGIVQGTSGSGKSHMIKIIADLMPQEDVLRFTRITESSLYNWGEFDLFRKIIIIEDLDGLKEEALYSLRELISNQYLSSSVSIKDKKGNNKSAKKEVKGQFASLSATTKGEIYEDNMNRSFIIAVDESPEQTKKIIKHQNKIIAGEIDPREQQKAVHIVQDMVRHLKHYEVQNPFASKIELPEGVRNLRRLNDMFQKIIKQITLLHQYQRKVINGFLITEIQDIILAIDILFESVILKMDELDGSSRQFFEKLKKAFKEREFNRFEAMEATGFKKTQLQHYLNELVRLEYLRQYGHSNKGFKYKVSFLDNNNLIRQQIKQHFKEQVEKLQKTTTSGNP